MTECGNLSESCSQLLLLKDLDRFSWSHYTDCNCSQGSPGGCVINIKINTLVLNNPSPSQAAEKPERS